MSLVLAIKHKDGIVMGGDSAYSVADDDDAVHIHVPGDPVVMTKVFKLRDFGLGLAGSLRALQIIQFSFVPPAHLRGGFNMAYMVAQFVPTLRNCLTTGIRSEGAEGEDVTGWPGELLVVKDQMMFVVGSDFSITATPTDWEAVGAGWAYAAGCLYGSRHRRDPHKRVEDALEVASMYEPSVKPPFTFMDV